MSTTNPAGECIIVHPTDLAPEGGIGFQHAVALSRELGGLLYSLHANPVDTDRAMRDLPDAADQLRAWRGGADGSLDEELAGVRHYKVVHRCCEDPVDTLLDAMADLKPDLVVLGKHGTGGFFSFAHDSVAESLARNTDVPTLFLPIGGRGFVSKLTGALHLRRIVLPVRDQASLLAALDVAAGLFERLGLDHLEFALLHVGDDDTLDRIALPETPQTWTWRTIHRQGKLEDAIIGCADDWDADLIVMATEGHDSLEDTFAGSHTERVARKARYPVLSVPVPRR